MAKRKRTNNDLQNTAQKRLNNTNHIKKGSELRKGKKHLSYYLYYKSGDKSFIWKGPYCDYDQRNMFIDDADIMQLLTRSWWQS